VCVSHTTHMCHQKGDARSQRCGPAMGTTSQRHVSQLGLDYRRVRTSNLVINHGKEWARLNAHTDDFAVSASSQSYLKIIRGPFTKVWKINIQRFTAENSIIQHAGIKIQQFPDGSISMTNPKAIHSMLQAQGLQDCNLSPTPCTSGFRHTENG
jgi:hypothetical protein